jgi:hypothetical protein
MREIAKIYCRDIALGNPIFPTFKENILDRTFHPFYKKEKKEFYEFYKKEKGKVRISNQD